MKQAAKRKLPNQATHSDSVIEISPKTADSPFVSSVGKPPLGVVSPETSEGSGSSGTSSPPSSPPGPFVPIPIASFQSGANSSFDIYIRLGDSKYVLVVRSGQEFSTDRLGRYAGHDVKDLYLSVRDFSFYVEQCLARAQELRSAGASQKQNKLASLAALSQAVTTELMALPVDDRVVHHVLYAASEVIEVTRVAPELAGLIDAISSVGETFARHSLGVSTFSVALAQSMGWRSQTTLKSLALSGFLHDLGFKELPAGLWSKRRIDMTPDEVALYESHPERGRKILQGLKAVPGQVVSIVLEHHESPNGSGFPRGLRFDRILPLSRLVALADLLAHEIWDRSDSGYETPKRTDLAATLLRLRTIHEHDFPSTMWEALQGLIRRGRI
jgi:HD-GYP domain-containing protein (c-di-GMP phosphodiesterase class II)